MAKANVTKDTDWLSRINDEINLGSGGTNDLLQGREESAKVTWINGWKGGAGDGTDVVDLTPINNHYSIGVFSYSPVKDGADNFKVYYTDDVATITGITGHVIYTGFGDIAVGQSGTGYTQMLQDNNTKAVTVHLTCTSDWTWDRFWCGIPFLVYYA